MERECFSSGNLQCKAIGYERATAALAAEKAARERAEAELEAAAATNEDEQASHLETMDLLAKEKARADAAERALGEARRELDSAWAATDVAGEIRGLTTLDDWVRCHMERHGELKEIIDVQAGIIAAARAALAGEGK